MRVPAFQPAPHINLDEFERRLRGEGAQQAGSEDPLSELVRLVESSRRSSPSPSRSGANVPGRTGTRPESTQPFEIGTPGPSTETHDDRAETTAVDPEDPRTIDAGNVQARDRGPVKEAIESRSPGRRLIAPALALAGVAMIGSVFALKARAPGPPEQPLVAAATENSTEVKPPNDNTVAASGDAGPLHVKDSAQWTQVAIVKDRGVDLSAQPSPGGAPPLAGARADVSATPPALPSSGPVEPKVDPSAVMAEAAAPPARSPDPQPVRTVSLPPDGAPGTAPVSSGQSIKASPSSADAPTSPVESAPKATNVVGTAQPLISRPSLSMKRPGKSPPRAVLAKTAATAPTAADTRSQPLTPGTPATPEKATSAPKSAQGAIESAAAQASPAESAQQPLDRLLHSFGDLFGARTPPSSPPVNPTAASTGWTAQLAAPKSEAEAKSDLTRLNAKYASALNGSRIGVQKAIVNGETMYRLRVVNMSKGEAAALCARLNADGGNCSIEK